MTEPLKFDFAQEVKSVDALEEAVRAVAPGAVCNYGHEGKVFVYNVEPSDYAAIQAVLDKYDPTQKTAAELAAEEMQREQDAAKARVKALDVVAMKAAAGDDPHISALWDAIADLRTALGIEEV